MRGAKSEIEKAFEHWYMSLKPMKRYGGRPAKGMVAAALVVLEHLRNNCNLDLSAHVASGGAQIAGLTRSSLGKILERFSETRPFPSEAGRTNRGNIQAIELLLRALADSQLDKLQVDARQKAIDDLQEQLVGSLDAYYSLEGIRFDFDAGIPPSNIISEILHEAQKRNQSGPVAQHLVGAKLAIRFPHIEIGNFPYSAADEQAGRAGDFQIGQTAFHVTVAPNQGHIRRCAQNLKEGLFAYLLVSDGRLAVARAMLEDENLHRRVAVGPVESFVGQNLSELSEFAPDRLVEQLSKLLNEYNTRIGAAETDTSLRIDIPSALREPKV